MNRRVFAVVWLVVLDWTLASPVCDRTTAVGDHVELSAWCLSNGSVVYEWEGVRDSSLLGHLHICYTCASNNETDCMEPSQLKGSSSLSLPSSNCVFDGCYVYSKASENFPTLAIPSATCTNQLEMTVSVRPTPSSGLWSSSHFTPPTMAPDHSATVSSENPIQYPPYASAPPDPEGIPAVFVALSVLLVMAGLTVLVSLTTILFILCKKRTSFRERINKGISDQGYDYSAPDPVSVHSFTKLEAIEEISLYDYLYEEPPCNGYVHYTEPTVTATDTESEDTQHQSDIGSMDRGLDDLHSVSMLSFSGDKDGLQPYDRDTLSPTAVSDASGYVDCGHWPHNSYSVV